MLYHNTRDAFSTKRKEREQSKKQSCLTDIWFFQKLEEEAAARYILSDIKNWVNTGQSNAFQSSPISLGRFGKHLF